MKSVMISINPKRCEKIANGEKTIEVRKTRPKIDTPFKCYIYCHKDKRNEDVLLVFKGGKRVEFSDYRNAFTYDVNDNVDWHIGNGKVIGEFVCDEIIEWQYDAGRKYYVNHPYDCTSYFPYLMRHSEATGLKCSELEKYGKGKTLYGWHISDLVIYEQPKEVSEFQHDCNGICLDFKKGIVCEKAGITCEGLSPLTRLTRPPMSWCYVEEKE